MCAAVVVVVAINIYAWRDVTPDCGTRERSAELIEKRALARVGVHSVSCVCYFFCGGRRTSEDASSRFVDCLYICSAR